MHSIPCTVLSPARRARGTSRPRRARRGSRSPSVSRPRAARRAGRTPSDPTITGVALVGKTLKASRAPGARAAGVTYKYQWLRCRPGGRRRLVRQDVRHDHGATRDRRTRSSSPTSASACASACLQQQGRDDRGDERRDVRRRDAGRQARELGAADDLRQRGRRVEARRATGRMGGRRTDHVHVPVAPLRQGRQRLQPDRRARRSPKYTLVDADQPARRSA